MHINNNNTEAIHQIIKAGLPEFKFEKHDGLHTLFAFITSDFINYIKQKETEKTLEIINLINKLVDLQYADAVDAISTTLFISLHDEFYETPENIPIEQFSAAAQNLYMETIALWKAGNSLD